MLCFPHLSSMTLAGHHLLKDARQEGVKMARRSTRDTVHTGATWVATITVKGNEDSQKEPLQTGCLLEAFTFLKGETIQVVCFIAVFVFAFFISRAPLEFEVGECPYRGKRTALTCWVMCVCFSFKAGESILSRLVYVTAALSVINEP